ncbi:hypothetical protein A3A93_06340 [Candidatus Roizmanbacteria bacterium RIFCSPLOWO2_01_FULL_38_12]|uniref:Glycosyltransferase 2-like domain-containing protein n=2 Tax=Candidatus Roizmaniibacteriota TaxID=1752723 RepID=A0A1F7HIZ8_9BACT|nr:MAG: hypothetical protein A3F29_03270 [Candidatus Roizmanbacteria bacterium RIFCSPHIGHO2_12_FULL_33_9]OGK46848.1 MAG: hypothetical protein A3A93_06340 [Candidatus Roizmanbacteria bacterium RIFCSPLOWO2_01_FULL_38_12]
MPIFFSIIIPARELNAYLHEETLPAIESQTYRNLEVIIVADNLHTFANEIKLYPFLKLIESSEPPGVKRDLGAKNAGGQVLVFIDDDTAPMPDLLKNANVLFSRNNELVAAGGPGILPPKSNFWEKIFDTILTSFMGSGGYTYRFKKEKERYTDDYPSMNLFIKKDEFLSLSGFGNDYWPGEDSKLGEKLRKMLNKRILYHPDLASYHHRRTSPFSYLKQHWKYGFMRGLFFAQGDKNSMRAEYLMPLLFLVYLFVYIELLFAASALKQTDTTIYMNVPLLIYIIGTIIVALKGLTRFYNPILFVVVLIILPLTHIIYGIGFAVGYTTHLLKRREQALEKK